VAIQKGAIMYTLANIDFSNRVGAVVSALPPDEIGGQGQTLDAKGALSDVANASGRELEMAVFGAP
jgi:hypothetical protein